MTGTFLTCGKCLFHAVLYGTGFAGTTSYLCTKFGDPEPPMEVDLEDGRAFGIKYEIRRSRDDH